jgi:uncharacterized RDD family membrane protein YckC
MTHSDDPPNPPPDPDEGISMSPVFDSGDSAPTGPFTSLPDDEPLPPPPAAEPSPVDRVSSNLDELLKDPNATDRPEPPPVAPVAPEPPEPPAWEPPSAPPAYPPPPPAGYGAAPILPPPTAPPPNAPTLTVPAMPGALGLAGRELATWGQRVWATLIDTVIYVGVLIVVAIIAVAVSGGDDTAAGGLIILGLVLWFLFAPAAFMARGGEHNGQTPGKQVMGIRVVRDTGEAVSFGFAMLREVVIRQVAINAIGGFLLLPPLLDVLWPLWDGSRRALHDIMANTHVVKSGGTTGLP